MDGALAAVRSGTSVNAAATNFKLPRRTLRAHLQKDEPVKVKRLGRSTTLTAQQETELVARIIRMQKVGFGLTRSKVCQVAFRFVEKLQIPNQFKNGQGGRRWFEGFVKRHPEVSVRTPESLSYGRLMRFNKVTVSTYFDLLRKTLEELNLVNKPELIYNMDETGLQLCYGKPEKNLAETETKRVHAATNVERVETVTMVGCVNGSGSNWIPLYILYKGKNRKSEFGDGPPPGSEFAMCGQY